MDHEARVELMPLIEGLTDQARTYIASLPEQHVILLHHGFGMGVRNEIRAGGLWALFRWSQTQVPHDVHHFDNVTWPIIYEVWKTLRLSVVPTPGQIRGDDK
jgi:hypothetical protein